MPTKSVSANHINFMLRLLAALGIISFIFGARAQVGGAGMTGDKASPEICGNISNCLYVQFQPTNAAILNPERGWYIDPGTFNGSTNFSGIRALGATLVRGYVRLDPYLNSPIPQRFLDNLAETFGHIRSAGIKAIPRFVYNYSGNRPCTDAIQSQILDHINQLTPTLQANADVIAIWEAGFIGCWGQWWGSSNKLNTNRSATAAIINAELDALPTIQIAVPYPDSVRSIFGAADPAIAFKGSNQSRVGIHHDCFQSSKPNDEGEFGRLNGKYVGGSAQITADRSYMQTVGTYAANGGEGPPFCIYTPTYSDCAGVLPAMASYQMSFFSISGRNFWAKTGCESTLTNFLGYRLELQDAGVSKSAARGGNLAIQFEITNRGYGHPFNPRPLYAVLSDRTHTQTFQISNDWRTWQPSRTTAISAHFTIPHAMSPGIYSLYLWMPDSSAKLQSDSRYSVEFANTGIWGTSTGYNQICARCVTIN